jgi:lipopolysaccharide/colanic/teichoic acid biosynthesis glycosyltransferase
MSTVTRQHPPAIAEGFPGPPPPARGVDLRLRALDLLFSGAAVVVLSPLLALIALGIRLTSGRPILYRGQRVGRFGLIFTIYKFRTLAPDAETRLGPYYGPELTRRTEDELTRLGRVLRALYLDELPQLFNVVRGDMSLVGPRPIRPVFFEELTAEIPQYWQRMVIRPGLTGFAQMRVTRELSWSEKLSHDFEYIADRSIRLYLIEIFRTAGRVLLGIGQALTGRGTGRKPLGGSPAPDSRTRNGG